MNAAIAMWIGNIVMICAGLAAMAGVITGTAYLCNFAVRKLLESYGGWKAFREFCAWHREHKSQVKPADGGEGV